MSYREHDIKHEAIGGRYWVLDTRKTYAVMEAGITHSTLDSAYERNPDGLSVAVARCNYLAVKRADTHL